MALSHDAAIQWLKTKGGTYRSERYGDTDQKKVTAQVGNASRSAVTDDDSA
jgi:hypothetical protein